MPQMIFTKGSWAQIAPPVIPRHPGKAPCTTIPKLLFPSPVPTPRRPALPAIPSMSIRAHPENAVAVTHRMISIKVPWVSFAVPATPPLHGSPQLTTINCRPSSSLAPIPASPAPAATPTTASKVRLQPVTAATLVMTPIPAALAPPATPATAPPPGKAPLLIMPSRGFR